MLRVGIPGVSALLLLACASSPPPSPFSPSEIDHALEPVKGLEARCYEPSASARRGQRVSLDFRLEIAASGQVEAIPTLAEPPDAALIECFRRGLNELRFPARGWDRLELNFELGSPSRQAEQAEQR